MSTREEKNSERIDVEDKFRDEWTVCSRKAEYCKTCDSQHLPVNLMRLGIYKFVVYGDQKETLKTLKCQ